LPASLDAHINTTVSTWVDEANKLLIESLGEDWKQDYVVWDCAWGTGNLTRDYHFKELYCSTLYEHDLALGANYNKNATKFQYDFLNDDVEIFENLRQKVSKGYTLTEHDFWGTQLYIKAPKLIKNMLSRKKILFFINPPFSTTGDMASSRDGRGNKKPGLGDSKISRIMKEWKIGACSQQLYAQFLYRIYQLNAIFNNIVLLGSFTPTLIFTGKHYNWFHRSFNQYNFISGFTFQASEFADVKEGWAISFSIWDFTRSAKTSIKHVIKVISSNGTDSLFYKHSYIVPYNKKLSSFYQSNVKTDKVKDYPTMSTGINITNGLTKHDENCYGYLYMDTPRIEYNDQFVSLIPLRMKGNKTTVALYNDNVLNCLSIFAARRLITNKHATWINCKDEFMKPDISNPLYTQWESDSIVYALFNSSTHFSSLRNVQYNGNYINIYNHFYFMSRDSMKELSLKFNNDNIYYDLQTHATNERLGSKLLNNAALSNEARAVLEFVKQIIRISFKYREQFDDAHPEYHINTWDAGWYQVKGLLKAFMPDYLKKFDELYSILENKMRPLVYELGFLFE
jgi:hypothetical protein